MQHIRSELIILLTGNGTNKIHFTVTLSFKMISNSLSINV